MAFGAVGEGGALKSYANSGAAIVVGAVVAVRNLICVAAQDIAATTGTGALYTDGEFNVGKTTGQAIAQGEQVIWKIGTGLMSNSSAGTATGDITKAAFAVDAALSADTTVNIRLTPGTGVVI